ncbi:MAG: SAM-dependent methyltransferase [Paraglaciecola sp.]|jgi:SAM-dependent methyltransferase
MIDTKKHFWNESYERNENCILFPKEEIVKFLSRFIRAKQPDGSYVERMAGSKHLTALDFGCGMGRQTALLNEFGLDAYGVDLSDIAISKAKQANDYMSEKFQSLQQSQALPFSDSFFDCAIAESVLDSMSFDLAKIAIFEIDRVTRGFLFISLISAECNHLNKNKAVDEVVESQHERGTVQSYYDMPRIDNLLEGSRFKQVWFSLHKEYMDSEDKLSFARYYLVLDNC